MATTQDAFRKELERRFRTLNGALRETIIDNDALHLPINESRGNVLNVDPVDEFDFTRRSREEAFREWWADAVDEGFLEPLPEDSIGSGEHYSAVHVRRGYLQGVEWSDARANEVGIDIPSVEAQNVIQRPVHQEALQTIYERTYGHLETVSADLEDDVARILTEEMSAGKNSRVIGDALSDQIRTIQRRDARRIARSEIMNAHSNATGARYREIGVEQVNIVTHEPCPECAELAGDGPYDTLEATGLLPVHPNCVCALIPVRRNL